MPIQRIRQVMIAGDDFDGHCAFLEALGLSQQFRDGDKWAQYSAGDISLAIAGLGESLGVPAGQTVAVFEVTELDDLLRRLQAAGGSHGEIRDMGDHGRTVLIRDGAGAFYVALEK